MDKYLDIIENQAKINNIKIYMVGGAVRNNLLGVPSNDYDFVLNGNCHDFASEVAGLICGSCVNMHENTDRVISGEYIFDFSRLNGETLEDDLRNRDFTINSLAMDLHDKIIVDVNGGSIDIENKMIRHNNDGVFNSDPLRMLRAVRLSAQLGFNICKETKMLIRQKAELLNISSGERILEEIFKIFNCCESYKYIQLMDDLCLLEVLFPVIKKMKAIGKCRYHTVNSYIHSFLTLRYFEKNINKIGDLEHGEELKKHLNSEVNGKKRICITKFAAFLHDIGKPEAMHMDGDRISFRGHELTGEIEFKKIASRLSMSSKQQKIIHSVITGHMRILGLYKQKADDRGIYELFNDYKENTIDILLCSLCDVNATRSLIEDNNESKKYWAFIMNLVDRYYRSAKNKQKFLTGKDVIEIKGVNGINVGKILKALDEQYFYGNIKNKQDAIDFIKNMDIAENMQ